MRSDPYTEGKMQGFDAGVEAIIDALDEQFATIPDEQFTKAYIEQIMRDFRALFLMAMKGQTQETVNTVAEYLKAGDRGAHAG